MTQQVRPIRSGPFVHATAEREEGVDEAAAPPQDGMDAVREACDSVIEATGISGAQAAREIGVSPGALSQWRRGKYVGDQAAVAAKVRRWIDTRMDLSRRRLNAAGLDRHAGTAAWQEVESALAYAQASGDLALVVGPPGRGKTWGARRYCRDRAGASYVRMTPAVRSQAGLLGRIAASVGAAGGGSALATETAIVAALEGRGALLVVDEAHHLSIPLLDELRCLRDLSGAGLGLVADEPLLSDLPRCPQVAGRIVMAVDLRRWNPADAVEIAGTVLDRPLARDEQKLVQVRARSPRGLHAVRHLLSRAWLLAHAEGREGITQDDLEAAAADEAPEGGGA